LKKLSNEEAFEKILKKHGNKYLYPNFNYKGYRNKILIICEKHGEFNQAYGDHIIGCGCQLCGGVAKIDTKSFIKKSEIIHNYFYDYSKSKFLGYKNPIKIICPIHGEFIQKPHYHLKGRGCSKCGREKTIKSHSYTQDIFLSMAADIHKNKYSYPENYEHGYKNLKIICPIHGEFIQKPKYHLEGAGCRKCNMSRGETLIRKILEERSVNYQFQKKFEGCKFKSDLSFDFFIPEKNICIEYDGRQHSKSLNFFGGDKIFEIQKIKDNIKSKFCLKNKIKLIRIDYRKNKKEIINIINDLLD